MAPPPRLRDAAVPWTFCVVEPGIEREALPGDRRQIVGATSLHLALTGEGSSP
jgi:hypothetical protein